MQRPETDGASRHRRRALALGITIVVIAVVAGLWVANGGMRLLLPHAATAMVAEVNAPSSLSALEQHAFPATDPTTLKLASYRGAKLVLFFYEMSG